MAPIEAVAISRLVSSIWLLMDFSNFALAAVFRNSMRPTSVPHASHEAPSPTTRVSVRGNTINVSQCVPSSSSTMHVSQNERDGARSENRSTFTAYPVFVPNGRMVVAFIILRLSSLIFPPSNTFIRSIALIEKYRVPGEWIHGAPREPSI